MTTEATFFQRVRISAARRATDDVVAHRVGDTLVFAAKLERAETGGLGSELHLENLILTLAATFEPKLTPAAIQRVLRRAARTLQAER